MESVEIVNSMKLTKTEKRVLVVLLTPRGDADERNYPLSGNDSAGIAFQLWGNEAQSPFSGWVLEPLSYSAKTRISRTLNSLHRKGLVLRGQPIYQYGYFDHREKDGANLFNQRDLVMIFMRDYSGRTGLEITHSGRWYVRLPKSTKVWWMLTDSGIRIAEEIAGDGP